MTKENLKLKIFKMPHAFNSPVYATEGSAGMDLYASLETPLTIKPLERVAIPTGLVIEVPENFEAQIRARSGLAIKHGLCLANGIGTIDSDYRGEVKIIIINLGTEEFTINRGDRIAQMVICPVIRANLEIITEVSTTKRSSGGFGSTGISKL